MIRRVAALLMSGVIPTLLPAQGAQSDSMLAALMPVGKGSLNKDLVTLRFPVGALEIRFMPLNESVIRLLAPDAYKASSALVASQKKWIDSVATARNISHPGLAMVTFYAVAPNTRFDPKQLVVTLQSKRLQPIGILPLSPIFSAQQLGNREQAAGLVVFERPLPANEAFTVTYMQVINRDWENMLPRFETERVRIIGIAKRDTTFLPTKRPQ